MYFSLCTSEHLDLLWSESSDVVHKLKYTYSTAIKLERRNFSGSPVMWCQINIFFSTVLSSDSRIALNGKLTKAKAEYQNPTSIQFRWFNLFDEDINRETAWVHCGGKSVLSNDKFSLIDNVTIEEFDRSMTTMPQMISWYSEAFGTTEEEIAKVYNGEQSKPPFYQFMM